MFRIKLKINTVSLNNIYLMDTDYVLCEVRPEASHIIEIEVHLQGTKLVQTSPGKLT
jgi:hypothetical protein